MHRFTRPEARPAPAADVFWLGRCPVCGTSVRVDDQFLRREHAIVHMECELYHRGHAVSPREPGRSPRLLHPQL